MSSNGNTGILYFRVRFKGSRSARCHLPELSAVSSPTPEHKRTTFLVPAQMIRFEKFYSDEERPSRRDPIQYDHTTGWHGRPAETAPKLSQVVGGLHLKSAVVNNKGHRHRDGRAWLPTG